MLLLTPTVDCASTLELNIPLSNYSIFKWDAKKGHFPFIFGTEVVVLSRDNRLLLAKATLGDLRGFLIQSKMDGEQPP